MTAQGTVRIDKWLWAARFFKTRTQAADACKGGKIKVDGTSVKSSKDIKCGDIIHVQHSIITRIISVKEISTNRLSAKLAVALYDDLTPASEYERLKIFMLARASERPRGLGRPTKKERRELDKWDVEGWE